MFPSQVDLPAVQAAFSDISTLPGRVNAYRVLKGQLLLVAKYALESDRPGKPSSRYLEGRLMALESIPFLRRCHNDLVAAGQNVAPLTPIWRKIYGIQDRFKLVA